MKELISLVVPCFNEQKSIMPFYHEAIDVCNKLEEDYELLFIDDGSTDSTLSVIKKLANHDSHVAFCSFSRNFGKEAALLAGLREAKGDYVVVIDADLQDPPSLIPEMIQLAHTGEYDCIATRRVTRSGEPIVRSFFARLFYKIINRVSDTNVVDGARDFRLMNRKMVEAILQVSEYNRFSKGIFSWVGFRTYWLEYDNIERRAGESKWSFWKLSRYAMDGIINFSEVPLSIASWFGTLFSIIGLLAVVFIVVRRLLFGDPVAGWASTASIIVFIGGIQLFCLGIMGKYLSKVYMESKKRPHYIIAERSEKSKE